ncbi:DNA-directed RNA polymerase subunit H [archaeon]|nr:DNA-directed RNA polymerase subunit H [archaeon]
MTSTKKFEINKHRLVPKHNLLSEKEVSQLSKQYSIKDIPKILVTDPAVEELKAKEGDLIKIERESLTAGRTLFYRRVVNA